jgi:glyoxylase-like metal-dependent hydrolase (beta-lactamase superfamily II)
MSDHDSTTTKAPNVRDIAPGVRHVAVGHPFLSYTCLLDSQEGIIAFDAGVRGGGPEILAAADGPITKIVLSHAHADHRGAAPELHAPIYCHPDEVADAQADWPQSYLNFGPTTSRHSSRLPRPSARAEAAVAPHSHNRGRGPWLTPRRLISP